ncbi:hypothetical protein [Sorangium sp. So ce117]|uniref:hypothetical protein n=1 Tax=Sorangium sp. So ce117 TaxID=3133277 RepID=UPI003F6046C9
MDLALDLEGKLERLQLPTSRVLMPIFEAVMNSVQSIKFNDAIAPSQGRIRVLLQREATQIALDKTDGTPAKITGVTIVDNGAGFTSVNFRSFNRSESLHKAAIGGKGVGRFLWLKAYSSARISSRYIAADGKWVERSFSFAPKTGIAGGEIESQSDGATFETSVQLIQQKKEYAEAFPIEVYDVAIATIEHFMLLLLNGSAPRIEITDGTTTHDLQSIFEAEYKPLSTADTLAVSGQSFTLHHVRLYSGRAPAHRIRYCAHDRQVTSDDLRKRLGLPARLSDERGEFVWSTYAEGKYLDNSVDYVRHRFNIDREGENESGHLPSASLNWEQIQDATVAKVRERLRPFTAALNEAKKKRAIDYIHQCAPRFLALVPFLDRHVEDMKPNITDRELDEALSGVYYAEEARIREAGRKLRGAAKNGDDIDKRLVAHQEYLANVNHFGKAALAQYVAYRKVVLDFLGECLSIKDGAYQNEERVHDLIMPRRTTSEEPGFIGQNLWLVDERLVFHEFLVSDKEFTWRDPKTKRANKRLPDVFVKMAAFSDELPDRAASSIVLIEFKKPCRTEYTDNENPIQQVMDYAKLLRSGTVKDPRGRPIDWASDVPMYAYVLCDLTEKVRGYADLHQLRPTPDRLGFFGYMHNENYKLYIEVISYRKLQQDAERRNKVFFEKAGLV